MRPAEGVVEGGDATFAWERRTPPVRVECIWDEPALLFRVICHMEARVVKRWSQTAR